MLRKAHSKMLIRIEWEVWGQGFVGSYQWEFLGIKGPFAKEAWSLGARLLPTGWPSELCSNGGKLSVMDWDSFKACSPGYCGQKQCFLPRGVKELLSVGPPFHLNVK